MFVCCVNRLLESLHSTKCVNQNCCIGSSVNLTKVLFDKKQVGVNTFKRGYMTSGKKLNKIRGFKIEKRGGDGIKDR